MGLFDIFSNSDAQNAAAAQTTALNRGFSQLSGLYNQGANALQTNYAAALAPLTQQQTTNTAGSDQLAALLGLKPGTNIQDILSTLPGYQFTVNQGTQNVLRNQAATGQLNSGATDKAIADYTTGVANTNYTNYLAELQPFLGAANTGAANIAGVNTGLGNALNANLTNQGNAALSTQTAIGNAQAQADYANLAQSGAIFGALTSAAGNALGGWLKSDKHAKADIEPVGELFDGQTVYKYRYKGEGRHQIGLMAQEVERDHPEAVKEFGGVKHVHYDRATNYAAEIGRMLRAA